MSSFSLDSQRFENGFTEGGNVWANKSGPALFKWRFVRGKTDISPSNIKWYFENDGYQTVIIKKEGSGNPAVQTNLIQSTPLSGKVQGYVDSTDPTVFGFIISRATKSDPKEYQCAALFKTYSAQGVELSTKLSLQVLGNVASSLFVFFYYLSFFKVFFSWNVFTTMQS